MPPPPPPPPNKPVSLPNLQQPLLPLNGPKSWPIPKFDLRVEDLSHPGVSIFFSNINPFESLKAAVIASFEWLYTPEGVPTQLVSPVS